MASTDRELLNFALWVEYRTGSGSDRVGLAKFATV
jgi:hypothetical protein